MLGGLAMLTFTFVIGVYVCEVSICLLGGFLMVAILFSRYVVHSRFRCLDGCWLLIVGVMLVIGVGGFTCVGGCWCVHMYVGECG